ncbi:MAG: hypothetical protein ACOY5F_09905 [Pseudomonadota bacterium]
MTGHDRLDVRRPLSGWKTTTVRTIRVAYTAAKIGLAMMVPAHALPHCITTSLTVDCKTASTEVPSAPIWLP